MGSIDAMSPRRSMQEGVTQVRVGGLFVVESRRRGYLIGLGSTGSGISLKEVEILKFFDQ